MLTRLKVQNYKSLRDIDIPLNPLTVLVGPNAAGKSNIVDCISFLSEMPQNDLNQVLANRGGFKDVVWAGSEKGAPVPNILIQLEGLLNLKGKNEQFEYGLNISDKQHEPVELEWVKWGVDKRILYERKESGWKAEGRVGSVARSASGLQYPQNMPELFVALASAMQTWSVYDFQRSKIIQRQQIKKETRLAPDGSNAAAVLHWVRNEDVDTFNRLESLLKKAIPEVEHLLTPPDEQGRVYVAFKERHLSGRIPAWNISEGSARLVATLLALFVPKPPELVAIEAPDTALHPYLMEYLAEILKLGSRDTQIVITTHSPFLLNYLPPESLLIVTKEEGQTKVKQVERDEALKEALKALGLGEMWHAGHFGGVP